MLNPNVKLNVDTGNVREKEADYFDQFDLVILINQKYSVVEKINKICREKNIRSVRQ